MNSKLNVTKTKLEKTELLNQKLTDAMMAALKTVHSAAPRTPQIWRTWPFSAKARRSWAA